MSVGITYKFSKPQNHGSITLLYLYIQMKKTCDLLENCLYFSTAKLHRALERIAVECFAPAGVAPSMAFLLMNVQDQPGIQVGELAKILHLAPSTLTRFIDKLEEQGLLQRERTGRTSCVSVTKKAAQLRPLLEKSWHQLYLCYSGILGEELGKKLNKRIGSAGLRLE